MSDAFNLTAKVNLLLANGPQFAKQLKNFNTDVTLSARLTGVDKVKRQLAGAQFYKIRMDIDERFLAQKLKNVRGQLNQTGKTAQQVGQQISKAFSGANANHTIVVKQTQAISTGLNRASKEAKAFGSNFADSFKRVANIAPAVVSIYSLVGAFRAGIRSAIDFQAELVRLGQIQGKSLNQLDGTAREIRSVAKEYGVLSSSLLLASQTLSSADFSSSEVSKLLPLLAKVSLSPNFGADLESISDGIIVLKQFSTEIDSYGTSLSNVNTLATRFAVSSKDIIEILKRSGSTFSQQTKDFNQLAAIATGLKQGSRLGAGQLGTGLKSIFTKLQSNSAETTVNEIGGSLRTKDGGLKEPLEQLKELARLQNEFNKTPAGKTAFGNILEELVGNHQLGKLRTALDNIKLIENAYEIAGQNVDSLSQDAARAQDSLSNSLTKTSESLKEFFGAFVDNGAVSGFTKTILGLTSATASLGKDLLPLLPLLGAGFAGKGLGNLAGGIKNRATNFVSPKANDFKAVGGTPVNNIMSTLSPMGQTAVYGDMQRLFKQEIVARRKNITDIEAESLSRKLSKRAIDNNTRVLASNGTITGVGGAVPVGNVNSRARLIRGGKIAGGIAGATALVGASYGSESSNPYISSASSGAIGGASIGALALGLGANPIGAAVAGVVGGLVLLSNAFKDKSAELMQIKLDGAVSDALADPSLKNLGEVLRVAMERAQGIRNEGAAISSWGGPNKDFDARVNKDATESIKASLSPVAEVLKTKLNEAISSGGITSLKGLNKEFEVWEQLLDLSDNGLRDASTGLKKLYGTAISAANAFAEASGRLEEMQAQLNREGADINARAQVVRNNVAPRLQDFRNQNANPFQLQNVGDRDFFQGVRNLPLPKEQRELLGQVGVAQNVVPQVLANNAFAMDGDNPNQNLVNQLLRSGVAPNIVENIGNQVSLMKRDDFAAKNQNPVNFAKELLQPFNAPVERSQALGDALNARRSREIENFQVLQGQNQNVANARLGVADIVGERERFEQEIDPSKRLNINRRRDAIFEIVGGKSAKELTADLERNQAEFERTGSPAAAAGIQKAMSGLNLLADAATTCADAVSELARNQAALAGKDTYISEFLAGDKDQRRQFLKDKELAERAAKAPNGLQEFNIEEQQRIQGFLNGPARNFQNFAGVGKAGGEIWQQLGRQAAPELFKPELAEEAKLKRNIRGNMGEAREAREAIQKFEIANLDFLQNQLNTSANQFKEAAAEFAKLNIPSKIEMFTSGAVDLNIHGKVGVEATETLKAFINNQIKNTVDALFKDGPSGKPMGAA